MKKRIGITAMLMMIGACVFAQRATPGIDGRQHLQQARIHRGLVKGELTHREAAQLNLQQRHIRRAERRAKADGQVTTFERRRLNQAQNRASRTICRQRHDRQGRRG